MVSRQIVFRATEFFDAIGKVGPGLEWPPLDLPLLNRGVAHGLLPIDPGKSHWQRLHRSLDEQAEAIAALGGPGNLATLPEQIGLLGADKALSGGFTAGDRIECGFEVESGEGGLEPAMDAGITLRRAELIPVVLRWKDEAVGPIGVVGDEPAAGGSAHQRTQERDGGDVGVVLGVTERTCRLRPAVKAQDRTSQGAGEFEQGFVERHVVARGSRAGVEQEPGLGVACHRERLD